MFAGYSCPYEVVPGSKAVFFVSCTRGNNVLFFIAPYYIVLYYIVYTISI